MQIEERELEADQVKLGMFVCRLDRPWTDTPFPLQGFYVRDVSQIEILRQTCRRVWIDVELSRRGTRGNLPGLSYAGAGMAGATPPPAAAAPLDPRIGSTRYEDSTAFDEEIPAAREALEIAASTINGMIERAQGNQPIEPDVAHKAARPIVASVLRNADAMFWLNALRQRAGYAYTHALNCAALATAFGRHLGLPEDFLVELSIGGMLMDIGTTQVPETLLAHPGPLDAMSMARVRRHVELGTQILGNGAFGPTVREMISGHHERADGSGYPTRRAGMDIPLHVRIAAIVDSFDAMTSERPYAPAMARHVALQELYRARGTRYYPELIEQFISCLGVYPTGSLAELNTGEVVAIMAQNVVRRLRPRVLVLTGPDGQLLPTFHTLDLLQTSFDIEIRRPLPDRHAGIDIAELYL
ncbi:HD-GYP domain-containing protein [Cognatilysobacter lacus]|uniref:HD-GYP domain-containing protein n=1 Tax=Cognatilysobacter lacus TaxID=1643323 RepID=A0A5D8Z6X1_9GAMM|nr:HD-GYP domain-containing protein [Lysobacter lacus]TZF90668.1 HD-GYP domain-containing protein [Lysobacter lacus]